MTPAGSGDAALAGIIGLRPDFYDAAGIYYSVADNPTLDFSAGSLSVSAWTFCPLNPTLPIAGIISKLSDDTDPALTDFVLYWDRGAGQFKFRASNGTTNFTVSATSPTPGLNTWYHVFGWVDVDAHTINLQVDGGAIFSAAFTGSINHTSAPLRVSSWNLQRYWTGGIDEVGLWSRALGDAERVALYNDGDGFQYPFATTGSSASSRAYSLHAADDFGVNFSGGQTHGTVANGSNSLAVSNAATLRVSDGDAISIINETTGAIFNTVAVTVNRGANTITLADNAPAAFTDALVQSDSTAALQASLNETYSRGGADTLFPEGVVFAEGALGAANSILYYPMNAFPGAIYTALWRALVPSRIGDQTGALPGGGTVIISKWRTGSGTRPALLAARSWVASGTALNEFNFVNPMLYGFYFRLAPDPTLNALNFHDAACATVDNCSIDAGKGAVSPIIGGGDTVTEPTHSTTGLILPQRNNRSRIKVNDVTVAGYGEAFRFSELANFEGEVVANWCKDGFVREVGVHPSTGKVFAAECKRGLVILDSSTFLGFYVKNEAYNPGGAEWYVASSTDYFSDPIDGASGRIEYVYAVAGPGTFADAPTDGFANTSLCNVASGVARLGLTTFAC